MRGLVALPHAGRDDGVRRAVDRLRGCRELRDDLLALVALLEHADDRVELAARTLEPRDGRLHLCRVELHCCDAFPSVHVS